MARHALSDVLLQRAPYCVAVPATTDERDFRLERLEGSGVTILVAHGELDVACAAQFGTKLWDCLGQGPVVLDLAPLSFMDSSGVRALDAVVRELAPRGWDLRIRREMQDNVRQILDLTGVHGVLADAGLLTDDEERP